MDRSRAYTVAKQELTPYVQKNELRVSIEVEEVLLKPNSAQAFAVTFTTGDQCRQVCAQSATERSA